MKKENYDKFIFKGALALESYYDDTQENKELFDCYNQKLREYRLSNISKEEIVQELLSTINQIGRDKFIFYEDGDIDYKYNQER